MKVLSSQITINTSTPSPQLMPEQNGTQDTKSLEESFSFTPTGYPMRYVKGFTFGPIVIFLFLLFLFRFLTGVPLTAGGTESRSDEYLPHVFILIFGLLGLVIIRSTLLASPPKNVVLNTKGIRVVDCRTGFFSRQDYWVRWNMVTRIYSHRRLVSSFLLLKAIKELIVETGEGSLVLTSEFLAPGQLVTMFKIMAEKKDEFSNIKIEDNSNWLKLFD